MKGVSYLGHLPPLFSISLFSYLLLFTVPPFPVYSFHPFSEVTSPTIEERLMALAASGEYLKLIAHSHKVTVKHLRSECTGYLLLCLLTLHVLF